MRWSLAFVFGFLLLAAAPVQAQQSKVSFVPAGNPDCYGCKTEEWMMHVVEVVPHGRYTYIEKPDCQIANSFVEDLKHAGRFIADARSGNLYGALTEFFSSESGKDVKSTLVRGDLGRALQGDDTKTGFCKAICAVLPEGTKWTGGSQLGSRNQGNAVAFTNDPADDDGNPANANNKDSITGFMRWVRQAKQDGRAVCAEVNNFDSNIAKEVRLSVALSVPPGWKPPPPK